MSNNDINFGSHTCSHSILTKIDLDYAKKEIINSKKLIEEKLGKPIEVFCYPRGGMNDFSQIHYNILKKVGIKLAVSSIEGINKMNFENYRLKRISITLNQTISWFTARLCGLLS